MPGNSALMRRPTSVSIEGDGIEEINKKINRIKKIERDFGEEEDDDDDEYY